MNRAGQCAAVEAYDACLVEPSSGPAFTGTPAPGRAAQRSRL